MDPIAICGIGLRLPGDICNTQDFWDLLVNGRDARSRVDKERFNPDGFDDSLGGKLSIRNQNGYFLKQDLGLFDPSFFSMTRKEAERCDPQQRLLLEVTRECLEDAGEVDYRGRRIGCYIGSFGSTWMRLQSVDPQFPSNYLMTGVEDYMLSNRISYEYDLCGPSMTINTACSASLVALHEACSAIRNGSITGAVVGGACLQLSPALTEMMATEGTLSADGSCKSFDAKANGFARAEGITAIFIKRLDDAIKAGNPIRAVIRGSGSNSDGSRANLMQPQARTQEALMRQVYSGAGLDPAETAFVECHGTGTPVGDPIETKAVDAVFGQHGVYIGSIKPNIGHTEGSAGLASLIKAVLALEHGTIPPNIKLENHNPKIPLGNRLMVPVTPTPFPPNKKQRISINSFGIGGSNSHVVVDSFTQTQAANGIANRTINGTVNGSVNGAFNGVVNNAVNGTANGSTNEIANGTINGVNGSVHGDILHIENPSLVLFSANTHHSLKRQIELYTIFASEHPSDLPHIGYTRAFRRERLPHRAFTIFAPGGRVIKTSDASKVPSQSATAEVAMVFSGQGSQWVGMGKELLLAVPEFLRDLGAMDAILQGLQEAPDWSLFDTLRNHDDVERFNTAELSQPLCTALQIALLHHVRRLGITPKVVVGHSSGEIAAAYAAGHISLQMAIKAAFYRGLITKDSQKNGCMAVIGLGMEETSQLLSEGVVVACENSPSSSTISGTRDLVEQVLASVKKKRPGVFTRLLNVNMAYHSHHMTDPGVKYLDLLKSHQPSVDDTYFSRGAIFVSSVTRGNLGADTVNSAEYWVRNLVEPVRFASAIQTLRSIVPDAILLEIGPHSTLGGPLRQIHDSSTPLKYVATQKRGDDCYVALLEAFGQLYQHDVGVDFRPLFKNGRTLAGLPPYPWDHTGPSFWYENRISRASRFPKYPRHCLLGLRSLEAPETLPMWRNMLDVNELPWLLDHKVGSNTVFPFAGYVAVAGEAIRQISSLPAGSGYRLRHVVASTALILNESQPVELVTSLQPIHLTDHDKSSWYHFQIQSYDDNKWTEHCSGDVLAITTPPNQKAAAFHTVPRRVPSNTFYRAMARNGLRYGPEFALLSDITASATEQVAQARIVDANNHCKAPFTLHPAELDSCLHLTFVAATQGLCRRLDQLYVPTLIEDLAVFRVGESDMMVQVDLKGGDYDQCRIDCVGSDGEQIFSLKGVHLAPLENEEETSTKHLDRHGLARLEWYPAFDFADLTKFLHPPPFNREHLEIEHQLTFLCMLEEVSRVGEITPAKPHLATLREWLSTEISNALQTGAFPLVSDPGTLAQLEPAERRKLIDQHVATLGSGPHAPFAEASKRVCEDGVAIFSGERETIDILTRDNLLTEVYNHNSYEYGEFVRLLSKTKPNLRVLEVGAGTGGTTELILRDLARGDDESLPSYSVYTFTDVSAGFLGKAKERFSYAPNMEYRVFDASKHPSEQGFGERKHWYDLVIAANIVHATPYIGETLSNIRSLLGPGGILLLTEPLPTLKTVNYIFGHFSGWWLGEADGRYGGPLVGVERWDRELKASGFTGADTISYGAEQPYRQIMTIVSHAEPKNTAMEEKEKRVTLLCADPSSGVASKLKAYLEQRGWTVQPHELAGSPPPTQHLISCIDLEHQGFSANLDSGKKFKDLKNFLRGLTSQSLWLMPPVQTAGTENVRAAQFLGFSRSLRSELGLQLFTLEIDESDFIARPELVGDVFEKIRKERDTRALAPDFEYAVRDSQIYIPRFRPVTFQGELERLSSEAPVGDGRAGALRIRKKGFLDTLYWQEEALVDSIPDGHIEVEIRAIGMNAFDVLCAKGVVHGEIASNDLRFGCEASGVVRRAGPGVKQFTPGDRVMLFTNGGGFATHAVIPSDLAVPIPESMAFEEAATIPVCFGTVLHSLVNIARVEKGQTVLINSACGGVGLTTIQVCQMLGAEMYLTVGSEKKVKYLMETFGFPRERIFSSRDASFVEGIMKETNGTGVDVVLNSLSGELLHASWKCVAKFGSMIELGSRDIKGSGRLDMLPFGDNRSYHGVEGIQFTERPAVFRRLCELFLERAEAGLLRPIQPLTVFHANETQRAFRFLEDASHIGKVVVTVPSASSVSLTPHVRRIKFDPMASYLLTGGVGGLGRAIATWMVEHGARHLTFLSRSAGVSDTSKALFHELETMGCSTTAVVGHADKIDDVREAIRKSSSPIKGVLHLAMVLRDVSLMDMSWSEWQDVMKPKVDGAWNLHSALLSQDQDLDFFFLASSIISVLDASGQANYVAANSINEAFCRYRQSLGLPASVLNICPIEDVGFVAENEQAARSLQAQGFLGVNERGFLECLELGLLQCQASSPVHKANGVSSLTPWANPNQIVMGLHTGQDLDNPKSRVMWRRDKRMGIYHNGVAQGTATTTTKRDSLQEFLASLEEGNSAEILQNETTTLLIATEIGNKIYEYLLKPDEKVDLQLSLTQMGLDSLLSIELARWFQSGFGVKMSVLEIVGSGTLKQLATTTATKLSKKYNGAKRS